jgi:outer membrane protein TolC
MANKILVLAAAILIVPAAALAQNGPAAIPQGGEAQPYSGPPVNPVSPSSSQNPYAGSVPEKTATSGTLQLAFPEAVRRGLKQNMGALLSSEAQGAARGERWKQLSNQLPHFSADLSENVRQIDLATLGFNFPGIPAIVGPIGYVDARGYFSQSVFSWEQIQRTRSSTQNVRVADYTYQNARDLVVTAVGANYFQTIAAAARLETAEAQVRTAQALSDQASDRLKAGVAASIDDLRARVELQTRQQQVIAARNNLSKQKLTLARIIGLPLGQEFEIAEKAQFDSVAGLTVDEVLQRAYTNRADFQAAEAQVRVAELARRAATAEHYPTININADYGASGVNIGNSRNTYDVSGELRIPIFAGGHTHGDVLQAEASLQQSRSQLENLRGQIDQDVRNALFDLQSASDQVAVAKSNVDLAGQTLDQSQDRFKAGVTDNIEVVQAQESVAAADESYIESLYAYNLAKISVARSIGLVESTVKEFFKGF